MHNDLGTLEGEHIISPFPDTPPGMVVTVGDGRSPGSRLTRSPPSRSSGTSGILGGRTAYSCGGSAGIAPASLFSRIAPGTITFPVALPRGPDQRFHARVRRYSGLPADPSKSEIPGTPASGFVACWRSQV